MQPRKCKPPNTTKASKLLVAAILIFLCCACSHLTCSSTVQQLSCTSSPYQQNGQCNYTSLKYSIDTGSNALVHMSYKSNYYNQCGQMTDIISYNSDLVDLLYNCKRNFLANCCKMIYNIPTITCNTILQQQSAQFVSNKQQFNYQNTRSINFTFMQGTTILLAIAIPTFTAVMLLYIIKLKQTHLNFKCRQLFVTTVAVMLIQLAFSYDCNILLHKIEPATITIHVGQQSSHYTVSELHAIGKACTILYTVVPNNKLQIQFDTLSNNIIWSSPVHTDTGVYTVSLYSANFANGKTFTHFVLTLTVNAHRALAAVPVVASTIPNIDYIIDDYGYYRAPLFTATGNNCGNDNVYYRLSITANANQDTSFIYINGVGDTFVELYWGTYSLTKAGIYTVTLTGYLPTTPYTPDSTYRVYSHWDTPHINPSCNVSEGTTPASTTFTLTVLLPITCATSQQTITFLSSTIAPQSVFVNSTAKTIIVTAFTVRDVSNKCSSSDIVYTIDIEPDDGQITSFLTFNPTTLVISWTNPPVKGVFSATITGTIISGSGTYIAESTFILTVDYNCQTTTDTITISPSAVSTKIVKILSVASFVIVTPFTVAGSTYCSASDITYTINITPDNCQSIQFITFNPTTISWTSPLQLGTYTVKVTGKITNSKGNKVATTDFILKVVDCKTSTETITITPPSPADPIKIIYQSESESSTILPFTLASQFCTQTDIVHSITISANSNQNTNSLTFDKTTRQIGWDNEIMIGNYTVIVYGTIINAAATSTASVNQAIIVYCAVTGWFNKLANQDQDYILGEQLQVSIPDFIITNCNYVIASFFTSNALLNQNIKMTQTNEQTCASTIDIYTDDETLIGTHDITIVCIDQTTNQSRNITVTLLIYDQCSKVTIDSNVINDQSYIIGNYISPIQWQSFQTSSLSCITIKYTVKITQDTGQNIVDWFQVDTNNRRITVKQLDKSLSQKSSVNVTIIGQINGKSYLPSAQTQFNIMITPSTDKTVANNTVVQKYVNQQVTDIEYQLNDKNVTSKSQPFWQSIQINNEGGVLIYFSESLIIQNASQEINSTQLNVKILPFDQVNLQYLNFTWNVSEYTNTYFSLQLHFQKPLYVSANGRFKLDRIYVQVIDTQLFTSKQSRMQIKKETTIIKSIPPQLPLDKNANQALNQVTKSLDTGSKALTVSTLLVNLMMASSLALVWGMINAIQIINLLTSYNLYIPANVIQFFGFMSDISNFNFIDTAKVFDWLGFPKFIEEQNISRLLIDQNQTKQTGNTKNQLTGQYVFRELGSVFLIQLCGFIFLVIHILIYILTKLPLTQRIARKLHNKIKNYIFWEFTSRYLCECYFALALQVVQFFKTVQIKQYFKTSYNTFESIYLMIMGMILVFGPFSTTLYLYSNFREFRTTLFKQRFGELMVKLNWRYSSSCNYISIFCYRRLIQVLYVVILVQYPYAQVQLMATTSIFVIITFGYSNVYFLPYNRRLEFFNEATILLCIYHCFIFTDFVPEPEARYVMGYSMIASTLFNFIVNALLLIQDTIMQIVKQFKQMRKKYRFWIYKKKAEQRYIQMLQDKQIRYKAQKFSNYNVTSQQDGQFLTKKDISSAQPSVIETVLQNISEVSESDLEVSNIARLQLINSNNKNIPKQNFKRQQTQEIQGNKLVLKTKPFSQTNQDLRKVRVSKNNTVTSIGNFNEISKLIQFEEEKMEQEMINRNFRFLQNEFGKVDELKAKTKLNWDSVFNRQVQIERQGQSNSFNWPLF